ncbi:DUF4123 domain-containing protein [Pseudomonas putida]|uniref:DUF4123 domain-containing protein n=1 Tax=Pseudomonas putida TaxID=303 RepID=UPI002367048F|nr:DUF4123 domain-containing protein [Pseudomonas putida]MDD2050815.1 DUF4123 domain-containing protein [Pseudomonas putida]
MTTTLPRQWMLEQLRLGRTLCLMLDAESEQGIHLALLNRQVADQHYSVYRDTQASGLAEAGPFLFVFDNPDDDGVNALLAAPQRNWGWLASIAEGEQLDLLQHWRARAIVGTRPNQALYRFHDNRVLSRALEHLAEDQLPAYLGPAISVCCWQGECWQVCANPAPGHHAVPEHPAWLRVPAPDVQAAQIRKTNAHRYLLDQHLEAYLALAEQQDPEAWLDAQLALAEAWGWVAPVQLALLFALSLTEPGGIPAERWPPHPDETPAAHFERVQQEMKFWQGEGPL